jgi:hypothetical protein
MAAISQKLLNLIGGVSQQPDTVKINNQLRICDNYYPDVALGLTKRPGMKGVSKLANAVADGTWFNIFRDDQERYVIQFSKAGALKIWSANNGIQQTVNAVAAEATAYAVHSSFDDLATLQINDYVFVLNRNIKVTESASTSAAQTPFAFVTVATIAYSSTYIITLNGTNFTYATPTNGNTQLNVVDIVSGLTTAINANASWVADTVGNNIRIRRNTNVDFTIEAKGGSTGTAINAYKGVVPSVASLPTQFFNDLKVEVGGSEANGEDDYWVKFRTADGSAVGIGHWEETIAPSTILGLNEETMPHVIIREANGTFTYRKLDEASAIASAGTSAVTGIPTAVSITNAYSGGHVIGEQIETTGGTGKNLRIKVDKIRSNTVTNVYSASSSTYVRQVVTTNTTTTSTGFRPGYGPPSVSTTTTRTEYRWYLGNVQIGVTTNTNPLVIGDTTYLINSAFQSISNETRAGITSTQTTFGIIDGIIIEQPGQGYTATNVVSIPSGDSFTITSVNTQNLSGDDARLQFWKPRQVGDTMTNPTPSFVGFTIDGISFFKNRLILTSRQNVICSQAGDYFHFFSSTVITIVDSDPIDISASSLKPIRLKHAVPAPGGLILFGDNAQYILQTTTESFSPKTAEINLLSSYSQSDKVSPVDIGPSFVFVEEGIKAASLFEMNIGDNIGNKPVVAELTRLIPSYVPSAIKVLKTSQAASTVAMLSSQDLSSLYLYRFFIAGDTRVSGWFRWQLPGTIEHFDFDQDLMYVITKHSSNYVLSVISLVTETPSESLLFEGEYLDVRLDLFDYSPTLTYDAGTDLTHVCFKDGFEDTNEEPVLMFLNPDVAGYFEEQSLTIDLTKPVGQRYFLTVEGNQTTSSFAVGYKYEALAQLPAFYYTANSGSGASERKDTVNVPYVSRIKIDSYNSGPYRAVVRAEGRNEFVLSLPQVNANYYRANNIPIVRNAQSTVPVLAKGNQFEFELIADSPFPTAFTSVTWEGTYNTKGISRV